MGSRIRLHGGRLFAGGRGWGPRIRLHGGRLFGRTTEVGARVPASVFMGAGSPRGDGDGFLHPREKRMGEREEGRWAGGVAAGGWDGFPHTRGQRMGEREEGWWIGGVAGGAAFEYNGLKYPQIPVV